MKSSIKWTLAVLAVFVLSGCPKYSTFTVKSVCAQYADKSVPDLTGKYIQVSDDENKKILQIDRQQSGKYRVRIEDEELTLTICDAGKTLIGEAEFSDGYGQIPFQRNSQGNLISFMRSLTEEVSYEGFKTRRLGQDARIIVNDSKASTTRVVKRLAGITDNRFEWKKVDQRAIADEHAKRALKEGQERHKAAKEHYKNGDYDVAAYLNKRACEDGVGDACVAAGSSYAKGVGVGKDMALAAKLYGNGCDQGHAFACFVRAGMHLQGRGGSKDIARGADLAKKACNADFSLACTLYADVRCSEQNKCDDEAQSYATRGTADSSLRTKHRAAARAVLAMILCRRGKKAEGNNHFEQACALNANSRHDFCSKTCENL